ncbi:hypothetical protein FOMA001_g20326 [Fusarium oxysporum f. sp. matthiolae]|nr:hypothetical protein FOMA001_g20326 [Fusarium oxysporum f. sp. matthiolae]
MNSQTVRMALAKREDLILMMPKWLIDIDLGKKKLDAKDYTWSQSQTKSAKRNSTPAEPKPPTKPKKTPAKPTTAAKPKRKAAAKPKKTAAKSEPKAAAKSKTKAKSMTSVEPLTEYDVWVDDSGLTYDAYLTQTNSVTNRDRYYRIQVRKDLNHRPLRQGLSGLVLARRLRIKYWEMEVSKTLSRNLRKVRVKVRSRLGKSFCAPRA